MTKRTVFATAAAVFAVSTFAAAAHADYTCAGANACKGQSACKSGASSCKGQNACKGQGFVVTATSLECTAMRSKQTLTGSFRGTSWRVLRRTLAPAASVPSLDWHFRLAAASIKASI